MVTLNGPYPGYVFNQWFCESCKVSTVVFCYTTKSPEYQRETRSVHPYSVDCPSFSNTHDTDEPTSPSHTVCVIGFVIGGQPSKVDGKHKSDGPIQL